MTGRTPGATLGLRMSERAIPTRARLGARQKACLPRVSEQPTVDVKRESPGRFPLVTLGMCCRPPIRGFSGLVTARQHGGIRQGSVSTWRAPSSEYRAARREHGGDTVLKCVPGETSLLLQMILVMRSAAGVHHVARDDHSCARRVASWIVASRLRVLSRCFFRGEVHKPANPQSAVLRAHNSEVEQIYFYLTGQ